MYSRDPAYFRKKNRAINLEASILTKCVLNGTSEPIETVLEDRLLIGLLGASSTRAIVYSA